LADALDIINAPTPEIVHRGVYTLWKKPDGTLRVQYRRDDKDEDDYIELPAAMVELAQAAADGKLSPMDMVMKATKLFTMRR
jgi:hypothetical protein